MDPSETLRIVSKAQYDKQTFIPLQPPSTPLPPSSVRIQTKLLSLTSNNLAYCAAGDLLHWWSTFPLPQTTPPPYNDSQTYGISPAWGYCSVTESTIPTIEPGRVLYGFVPISGHTVELQLRQVETIPEHWIEISPHRSKVMNLYQRYFLLPHGFSLDLSDPVTQFTPILRPVWEAGYLLAKYVFSQDKHGDSPPVHPLGSPVSPWTDKEADLSDSCIVCVAAGTKTCRSFLYELAAIEKRKGEQSTFSVVEVTGGSAGCEAYLDSPPPFQHKRVEYSQIAPEAFPKHRKYILLNFGGRGDALARVAEAVTVGNEFAEMVIVQIGGEARVISKEELVARREMAVRLNAVQMNATGIRDEAMRRVGEVRYFGELNAAFEGLVRGQVGGVGGRVLGIGVVVGSGLEGEEGVEGWWGRLAGGLVGGDEGVVVRVGV